MSLPSKKAWSTPALHEIQILSDTQQKGGKGGGKGGGGGGNPKKKGKAAEIMGNGS